MKPMQKTLSSILALGLASSVLAADHVDSPAVAGTPNLDIADVYVFEGASASQTVFIMTVSGFTAPGNPLNVADGALYQFKIDSNGDNVEDFVIQVTPSGANYSVSDVLAVGSIAGYTTGTSSNTVGATSATAVLGTPTGSSGDIVDASIALADDPFFFDFGAFTTVEASVYNVDFDEADGTVDGTISGTDSFAGSNVTAIVVEVNDSALPAGQFGVWATSATDGGGGNFDQFDRMGKPALNTVFYKPAGYVGLFGAPDGDTFNSSAPSTDGGNASTKMTSILTALSDGTTGSFHANNVTHSAQPFPPATLTSVLLPDVIQYNPTLAGSSYLGIELGAGNSGGRALADDVIDLSLFAVLGTAPTNFASDGVGANDKAFSGSFPYLAADTPLSVELTSFNGNYSNGKVTLNWSTSSENKNLGFNIYRTKNNEIPNLDTPTFSYEKFAELRSQNPNSASEQFYNFTFKTDDSYYYWIADVEEGNIVTLFEENILVKVEHEEGPITRSYRLNQNFPNPFNPSTTIQFSIARTAPVNIQVFNFKGQLVKTLVNNVDYEEAQLHEVAWDGTDNQGNLVSSGTYLYQIKSLGYSEIKKATFIK
ncbi:MAG: DUF4331 domain-containing protein [Calditrichaeota bacterium]|nr:MAG: DUF4331 domain-containing protein [Calditrichota bacterium]